MKVKVFFESKNQQEVVVASPTDLHKQCTEYLATIVAVLKNLNLKSMLLIAASMLSKLN